MLLWFGISQFSPNPSGLLWVEAGRFSKVVIFNHVGGSFNLFMATTGDVWIIPSFRIWDHVLHVEHVSCVITNCGQHWWVILSPLNNCLGFAGGKHYQKINIAIFRFVLLNFTIPDYFPYILSIAVFSSYFLLVGLILQYVALFQSKEVVKSVIVNWCRVAVCIDKST